MLNILIALRNIILIPFHLVVAIFGMRIAPEKHIYSPDLLQVLRGAWEHETREKVSEEIRSSLWCLRDQIHNLPTENLDLPTEDAQFVHAVYCRLPMFLNDLIAHGKTMQMTKHMAKSYPLDPLREKYLGKGMFEPGRPMSEEDFNRIENGDLHAALLLCDLIFRENLTPSWMSQQPKEKAS